MSLLLDALKRAEQEKSARQSGAPSAEAPRAASAPAKPVLELQPIADPARGVPPAAKGDGREAAAALMHAKLPADKGGMSKASIAWAIVAVAIVLVGCIAYQT